MFLEQRSLDTFNIETKIFKNKRIEGKIKSRNFSSVSVTSGTGIEVVLHYLDTDPLTDSLYIRAGTANSTTTEEGPTFTGRQMNPQKFLIMDNANLYVVFKSPKRIKSTFLGFVLTYAPFGKEIR